MKDDFYKDIKHKRTQNDDGQSKGKHKNKDKKDKLKKDNKSHEEQSMKRSAKYKENPTKSSSQFSDKIKDYFSKENLDKGKAFFAGRLSTYNKRFSNELKVTKEKINEFRNRPKNQNDTGQNNPENPEETSRNKGLVPMIIGGVVLIPVVFLLGFVIISNFWPSNDGMELATGENDTEEISENEVADEEVDEELDEQRFEMERRMAESRGSENNNQSSSGDDGEDTSSSEEETVEGGGDLASENIESGYSDEEIEMLEDITEDAIDEKESGEDADTESSSEESEEDAVEEEQTEGSSETSEEEEVQTGESTEEDTESAGSTHVVTSDDNLFQIAKRYYGDGSAEYVQRIRDANGISGNNINEGQELIIP